MPSPFRFDLDLDLIKDNVGLDYDQALPRAFLDEVFAEQGEHGFKAASEGRVSGHFHKFTGRVVFTGKLALDVAAPCKRCLDAVTQPLPVELSLTWAEERAPSRRDDDDEGEDRDADGEAGASFSDRDVETESYEGDTLHLDPTFREQILLALPMDALCKESCQGLCVVCGGKLAEVACGHEQKVADPRWSALGKLKLN